MYVLVLVWDTATRDVRKILKGKEGQAIGLAFLEDGKLLAVANANGKLTLWDLAAQEPRLTVDAHARGMRGFAATSDGALLAAGSLDKTVQLWDAAGKAAATLTGQKTMIGKLAFSHDGKLLATATGDVYGNNEEGRSDEVRLWDVASKQPRAVLQGPRGSMVSVAFTPDAKTVITGGRDGILRLWDFPAASKESPVTPPAATEKASALVIDKKGNAQRQGGQLILVDLSGTKITDADLDTLRPLTQLRTLRLDNTPITAAGLNRLTKLKDLEELSIIGTMVTEDEAAAFEKVAPGCSIRWSADDLVNAMINQQYNLRAALDEFAARVRQGAAGDIVEVDLGRRKRKITDAGLKHLRGLTTLESLGIYGDSRNRLDITDAGLAQLVGLDRLEQLNAGGTKITDAGLVHLQKLPNLKHLDLRGTAITDRGVAALKKVLKLESISLGGTFVTQAGARELKQHFPGCNVQLR